MARSRMGLSVFVSGCLFVSFASAQIPRTVRIPPAVTDIIPNELFEDALYQRIEVKVESVNRFFEVTPVDFGDLKVECVISTGTAGSPDIEPGFDFTPDIGPLPATVTLTIKEGQSESNLFILQILDDCIDELQSEPITITPVGTVAYTDKGSSFNIDQTPLVYSIDDNNGGDSGNAIEIHLEAEYPTVGLVFFEGEADPMIPLVGREACSNKVVPIDDTCTTSLAGAGDPLTSSGVYTIAPTVVIESDDIGFSMTIDDDVTFSIGAPPARVDIEFPIGAICDPAPTLVDHLLATDEPLRIQIIDDDHPLSAAIVYPAAIGRQETRDVKVCGTTSIVDTPTRISGNDQVCPYTTDLPQCKSTDLVCGEATFGQCTTFPKPKRHSRDRFGSYLVTARYDEEQVIPVFIRALSDHISFVAGIYEWRYNITTVGQNVIIIPPSTSFQVRDPRLRLGFQKAYKDVNIGIVITDCSPVVVFHPLNAKDALILRHPWRQHKDVLQPLQGPTITINNGDDVQIGVKFSSYVKELRWFFKGNELKQFRGHCNFKIHEAEHGVHDGYYEVARVNRGKRGYQTAIRLIIRRCGKNSFFSSGAGACMDVGPTANCLNGGVISDPASANPVCECPLGFYNPYSRCETVYPGDFPIGPPAKKMTCRDIDPDLPRDCKGALFCYPGLLGCLCPRGYWGPKCDRVCPHGRYGWSCLQHCHCTGPWEECDPKTGICKHGCSDDYEGPNCQDYITE